MNQKPNRLINEKSPYLLQHAYNPVDWYPWGEEAFEKAQKEDKLIFLSIGYSTCHWCHQMAHDAFSDEKTAKYLNDNYVSIKVDREERPDIDEVYMLACQILSDNCGWPLNVIMTSDKKPIFAATYMPSTETFGIRSLISILKEITTMWVNNRVGINKLESLILNQIEIMQKETQVEGLKEGLKEKINENTLGKAFNIFANSFDKNYGGFGPAPKFPTPHNLSFLLNWYKKSNDSLSLEMVEKTLNSMYQGGIFDHVGGGFHRYSTDSMWRVPHFEKMLYDQALITNVYIEAYETTKNELYADIAKKTLDFVLERLISPEGAFYSGLDADTDGEEGKFYVWTADEVFKCLGADAELFCIFYGITEIGNLESGKNVLYISDSLENFSENYNVNPIEIKEKFDSCLKKMREIRDQRTKPHIDDKIIASWNGLMIKSLAFAGRIFNDEKYTSAAIKSATFITEHLITLEGDVFRSFRQGTSNIKGFIEDYAFLVYGFLELYQATADDSYLELSKKLADKMIAEFYDEINGGFFLTSINAETPLIRLKSTIDQAIPSGNSIAALVLLMLNDIINSNYSDIVNNTFNNLGYVVKMRPTSYSQLLIAFLFSQKPE